jgi:putative transposon-encoded protein
LASKITSKTERYIYMYIYLAFMRTLKIQKNKLELKDEIETIFQKEVTQFGNGAKIDCPKKHLGKEVYVIVRKKN